MSENNNVVETCPHYANLDPNIKGNTKGCEECEKIGQIGCIYVCVLRAVM